MRRLILILVGLLCFAFPAHAAFTNVVSSISTTCTSGTTCGPSVTLACSATELCVAFGTTTGTATTISSCCGGAGCTWTQDVNHGSGSPGNGVIYHSTSCTVTSTTIGPTWSNACAAGPGCHSGVMEWTSTGGGLAVNGTPAKCTTFTWCSPAGTSASNSVFVSYIVTSGDASGCTGGSSPTCNLDANGNGGGWEMNITSYSAPSWSGTSGTNKVGTAAFSESGGGGAVTEPTLTLTGAGPG